MNVSVNIDFCRSIVIYYGFVLIDHIFLIHTVKTSILGIDLRWIHIVDVKCDGSVFLNSNSFLGSVSVIFI